MKRRNDNAQQRREEYEAANEGDNGNAVPSGPFAKASEEMLKRRRILNVSTTISRNPATPERSRIPVTGNPFAGVKLQVSAPTSNPFADLELRNARDTTAAATTTTATTNTGSGGYDAKTEERLAKLEVAWRDFKLQHPHANWSHCIRHYLAYLRAIMEEATSFPIRSEVHATNAPPTNMSTELMPPPPRPFGGFTFQSTKTLQPSPPVAQNTFTFGASTTTTTTTTPASSGFSFGASTTATPVSNSFSFGASTSATPVSTNPFLLHASTAPTQTQDEEEEAMPKEEMSKVEEVIDPNWNDVYKCAAAKYFKLSNGGWKSFCRGPIKVETHKTNGSRRMVMRDTIGKVQLNLSLAKGMNFTKKAVKGKTYIQFVALQDAAVGPENFMYQVRPDVVDEFLAVLKNVV